MILFRNEDTDVEHGVVSSIVPDNTCSTATCMCIETLICAYALLSVVVDACFFVADVM